jgi:S1 RNA binding domain protein
MSEIRPEQTTAASRREETGEKVAPGTVLEGTVVRVLPFGIVVELPGGASGLAHISELADGYIRDISEHFRAGERVRVKVLDEDDRGRCRLSVRQAAAGRQDPGAAAPRAAGEGSVAFEEKLKRFLRESQERLVDLRRNREAKLGGRTRK